MILFLPAKMMRGFWGCAPFPWLLILSTAHRNNAALIAHEQCHQAQQRRDGWARWVWRYTTSKAWRQTYELEAYRVWARVAPGDAYACAKDLATRYGLSLSVPEAFALITQNLEAA